jgi:hypothetical protein
MRAILAIIALAALGWTGWWFVIATAKERALAAWLADRRAAGWVAEAEAVEVGGFPWRVDTTVRGLELANPEAGWTWSAPRFQFTTLAYQPNEIIAIWPPRQSFATPFGATQIASETMRGSLAVAPNPRLELLRATIELADVTLAGDAGWTLGLGDAIFAARQAEGAEAAPFAYEFAFTAGELAPPGGWTGELARGVLDAVIETARLDLVATFDRPLDRAPVEGAPPSIERLVVRDVTLAWGRLDLRGKGALVADADGLAEGTIDLRARNWDDMLAVAERSGALPSGVAAALRGGLGLIARLGGDRGTLEAPLVFEGGAMRLGPVPIGPAPRLARRPGP